MSGEEVAYRDLEPGELYQDGDEWQSDTGRWIAHADVFTGTPHNGDRRSRRPYNITQMLRQYDELMRLSLDRNREVQKLETEIHHLETARKSPNFAEGVSEVLRRLEIAAEALDYLAEVGTHDEIGYACGFGAAIAVVKKLLSERPRGES